MDGILGSISILLEKGLDDVNAAAQEALAYDIDPNLARGIGYRLLASRPKSKLAVLKLEDLTKDLIQRALETVASFCGQFNQEMLQEIKIKATDVVKGSGGSIDAAISELEQAIDKWYETISSIRTGPGELLTAMELKTKIVKCREEFYGKKVGEKNEYRVHMTADEMNSLVKLTYVCYSLLTHSGVSPETLLKLRNTAAGLKEIVQMMQNPKQYDEIKKRLDPDVGVTLSKNRFGNLSKLFVARLKHGDLVDIGYSVPYTELEQFLEKLGEAVISAYLKFDYKGRQFKLFIVDHARGLFESDLLLKLSESYDKEAMDEFAGRLREYIDTQVGRLTPVYPTEPITNIGKLPEGNGNQVLRLLRMMYVPEKGAPSVIYEPVQNPKSDLGLKDYVEIKIGGISLEKVKSLALPSKRVWTLGTQYENDGSPLFTKIRNLEERERNALIKQGLKRGLNMERVDAEITRKNYEALLYQQFR